MDVEEVSRRIDVAGGQFCHVGRGQGMGRVTCKYLLETCFQVVRDQEQQLEEWHGDPLQEDAMILVLCMTRKVLNLGRSVRTS